MTDAEYEALIAADFIIGVLCCQGRSDLKGLPPVDMRLLDEAFRKVRPVANAEKRRRRANAEALV